jgi:hypothetical protein
MNKHNIEEAMSDGIDRRLNKFSWKFSGYGKPRDIQKKISSLSDDQLKKLAKTGIPDYEVGGSGSTREFQIKVIGRELKKRFGSIPYYFVKEATEVDLDNINTTNNKELKETKMLNKSMSELVDLFVNNALTEQKLTIDVDHTGDGIKNAERKYGIKIKHNGKNQAFITGDKKSLLAFLKGPEYDMDTDDIKDFFPELYEGKKAPVTKKLDDGDGMDPVGKGDADIDNDGDVDDSDKYLKNRRKEISKAIKKEDNLSESESVELAKSIYKSNNKLDQKGILGAMNKMLSADKNNSRIKVTRLMNDDDFVSDTVSAYNRMKNESFNISESFTKGDSVKIKNAKSYNALSKDEVSGTVIRMDGDRVQVKVGTGSMTVDKKDLIAEEVNLFEGAIGDYKELIKFANSGGGADKGDMLKAAALMAKGDKAAFEKHLNGMDSYPADIVKSYI